jgi:hypothetical protein
MPPLANKSRQYFLCALVLLCWRIGIFLLSGDLSFRAESLETHGSKGIFFLDLMSSKRGFATLFVLVVLSIFLRRQQGDDLCPNQNRAFAKG